MKLTLLESQRGHWWMSEGAAYSLTAHVLLISAVVAVTRSSPVVEDEKVEDVEPMGPPMSPEAAKG